MRALFTKEFLQGRPLLIFAAIMALLVPLCYLVFARAAFLYVSGYDARWLPVIFGFVVLGLPLLIAILSSAGLFSSEAQRGTLPILFALPLSRGRIWLAKLLAALALTIVGSLLVLVIGGALLPGPYRDLPIPYHLVELCCCIIFLIAVGALCSSLSRSINSALPTTLLLAGAVIAGAGALCFYYGAPLVGPPWLDIALWCCLTSPALLLASALVVTRGELLQSARKWLFGVPAALLVLSLTLPLVVAVTRASTRYARSQVQCLSQVSLPDSGPVASLLTHADAVKVVPQWVANLLLDEDGLFRGEIGTDDLPLMYRTNYAITLDLTTGRELSIARAPLDFQSWTRPPTDSAACSHDGRLVAIISSPRGLTWGIRQNRPLKLQIVDMAQDKLLYSGWPEIATSRGYHLSWSPSANYLVLSLESYGSLGGDKRTMYILNRDGSQSRPRPLILRSPSWGPKEDIIFGLDDDGNLCRAYPDDRRPEVIWSPEPKPEGVERSLSPQALSPDGKWFALLEHTERQAAKPGGEPQLTEMLRLVPTDSGSARMIWRGDGARTVIYHVTWSGDGQALFFRQRIRREQGMLRERVLTLQCWSRKTGEITRIGPEISAEPFATLLTRPDSDQVVFWGLQYDWSREPRHMPQVVGGMLALADSSGGWRPLPSPQDSSRFATEHEPVGFDSQGRLILLARAEGYTFEGGSLYSRLEALNLDTGQTDRIYP